jgi:hypothetical protein
MKKCGARRPHFFIETAKSGTLCIAFRLEKIEKIVIKGKLNPNPPQWLPPIHASLKK